MTQEGSVGQLEYRSTLLFTFKRMNLVISFLWNIIFCQQLLPHLVKLHLIIWISLAFALRYIPKKLPHPQQEGNDRCGVGYEVEGHWQCAAVLKVRQPQFSSGKLPLNVRIILHQQEMKQVNIQRFNQINLLPNYVKLKKNRTSQLIGHYPPIHSTNRKSNVAV